LLQKVALVAQKVVPVPATFVVPGAQHKLVKRLQLFEQQSPEFAQAPLNAEHD